MQTTKLTAQELLDTTKNVKKYTRIHLYDGTSQTICDVFECEDGNGFKGVEIALNDENKQKVVFQRFKPSQVLEVSN